MALPINFTQDLAENDLLFAYNNNIVEFFSDNMLGVFDSLKCEITINPLQANPPVYTIHPNSENIFWFNFKRPLINLLNQNDFADDFLLSVNPAAVDSVIIQDNAYSFKELSIRYKITFVDGSTETNFKTINVLKGVENLRNFALRKLNKTIDKFFWLSPFSDIADRKIYITYWAGYPFDIGYYIESDTSLTLTNDGDFQLIAFLQPTGRMTIDDGLDTIDTWVGLDEGINTVTLNSTTATTIMLTKVVGACGDYLKWINKYGKWNYWLFNQRSKTELQTKNEKPVYNDFEDLTDTISPLLSGGVKSKEVITLHSGAITTDEMLVLSGLFESPKVYLYLEDSGVQMSSDSFVEVQLKGQKVITNNYKGNHFNVKCQIELQRNVMTL